MYTAVEQKLVLYNQRNYYIKISNLDFIQIYFKYRCMLEQVCN